MWLNLFIKQTQSKVYMNYLTSNLIFLIKESYLNIFRYYPDELARRNFKRSN